MQGPVLDCKGLPCPQPVLQCKQCIDNDDPSQLTVVVDNEAARENVTRFMETKGYAVSSSANGDGQWSVTGVRSGEASAAESLPSPGPAPEEQTITVFVPTDVMGVGDDELGGKLMLNFLATLPELGRELWRVVLVNAGVRLAIPGHPCFEKIKALEDAGVTILVCGTCLDFFGLLEKKGLGQTTNMMDVVTALQLATKVIRV
ncbi:sulfurtransferase-like selenium metabolism protein YedF [Desulfocurvus sp. DL9XJH121]